MSDIGLPESVRLYAEMAHQQRWFVIVEETIAALRADVMRQREVIDMVSEERDAWKARALGLPQLPCRHADHPSAPDLTRAMAILIEDEADADD